MYYLKQLGSRKYCKLVIVPSKAAGKGYVLAELGSISHSVEGVRRVVLDIEAFFMWEKRGCKVGKSLEKIFKLHGIRS